MTAAGLQALPVARPAEVLAYGDAPAQRIEIFLPPARTEGQRLPVVVALDGNCWRAGADGLGRLRPAATALAERGIAVWAVGYRGIGDEGGGHPGTYADVAAALDRLADEAEARGLDPRRVVLLGHGTGGHLALWAALRHRIPRASPLAPARPPLRARGVVLAGALADIEREAPLIRARCGFEAGERLADPAARAPFADVSPVALLPIGAPVAIHLGVYDGFATPETGLALAQAIRRGGDAAELALAPNAGAYELIAPGTRAFEPVMAAIERFLR
ncbi:MAG: alpha/beta hydrolase [Thermaurantiacus sp.]|nr:alpha/beta hydrolase [Thermaurantiacus sp.]